VAGVPIVAALSGGHSASEFSTIGGPPHRIMGKIRKSSGSSVAAHHPGYGSVHSGQGPQVTTAHYFDPRIVQASKPMPTEL
jgi:hypothetical protein